MSLLPSGNEPDDSDSLALSVNESSQVGEARRMAAALAGRLGFCETQVGKAALVVTEAANNLVKHGGGGELLFTLLERDGIRGLEILALDRGPGMANLSRCLQDGYSTAGTPGAGLGAILRQSSGFDIHSMSPGGTALLARLWSRQLPPGGAADALEVGAVCRPHPAERVCGDAWALEQVPGRAVFVLADGLGHGPAAAAAAREAVRVFRENFRLPPSEILKVIDPALRSTRGAAVLVAEVDLANLQVCCAGVGNVSGTIFAAGASQSLVSHNGTVGHIIRKIQEFTYPFPPGALLVLHSDGLATSWRFDQYPGLCTRSAALIAGALYRDFKRGRDDVTVVVARDGTQDVA